MKLTKKQKEELKEKIQELALFYGMSYKEAEKIVKEVIEGFDKWINVKKAGISIAKIIKRLKNENLD